ncbi:hypothetical protein Nepgr_019035 [Nepenthes gracilis]|uniref:Nucleotide-diphospho-sugar transferase domain-containing protein n=1 Tax=Nepenthes gracilis TaxID=150966 RepID=A0AAD3SV10_NEPGR|nr:hypothetical protein Nepgr_019035 [Nepenthes gracilis]
MDSSKDHSVRNLALLSLLVAAVVFLSFWSPNAERFSLPSQSLQRSSPSTEKATEREKDELETALEKASMENKTVIIAVVNKAYAAGEMPTMLDLFLESFWVGEGTRELVDHLLVVAVDQTAYDRCIFRGLHCYRLETEGVDFTREEIYVSEEFIKMMWRRTLFLLDVLRKGFSFIFTV